MSEKKEAPEKVRILTLASIGFPPYFAGPDEVVSVEPHIADLFIKDGVAQLFIPSKAEEPKAEELAPVKLSVEENVAGLGELFDKQLAASGESLDEELADKKKKK
jgi:hypothetical protein